MAFETLDYIGDFATDPLASTHVQNRGWDVNGDGTGNPRLAMAYFNTVFHHMRYWDGSSWTPYFDPIMAKYYNSVLQTINNATFTTMVMNTGVYDTDSIFSSNTFTIPTNGGGVYHVGGMVTFVSNATGVRILIARVNGTTRVQMQENAVGGGQSTKVNLNADVKLNAGDVIDFRLYQTSTIALNTIPGIANVFGTVRNVGQ